MKRKYGRFAALLALCIMLLAGCGEAKMPEVVDTPSVLIGKEGEVTVWQVGVFDKADYILSELQTMAVEEAGQFNSARQSTAAVAVEKVEALEDGSGKVVVVYRFDGWESCADFTEEAMFFGTVNEAALRGFDMDVAMKSIKDGTPYSGGLQQAGDKQLVITDMKANIYCPGKVAYISDGAQVNEDGSIMPSEEAELVYILMK